MLEQAPHLVFYLTNKIILVEARVDVFYSHEAFFGYGNCDKNSLLRLLNRRPDFNLRLCLHLRFYKSTFLTALPTSPRVDVDESVLKTKP